MRLHHIALVCRSEENAARFYEGILGLKKIKASTVEEGLVEKIFGTPRKCQIILYGNENFAVEVFLTDSTGERNSPFAHHCLEVQDRESFLLKCRSAGLTVNLIPKGESELLFVEDYDGNLFEVKGV